MKNSTLIIISLISATIVFVAVGFNLYLIWNLLPVVAFYFVTKKYFIDWHQLKVLAKICLVLLALFLIVFPTLSNITWIFDIDGTKTGSSTAGLMFIFLPFWAFVFSLIPYLILRFTKRINCQNNGS